MKVFQPLSIEIAHKYISKHTPLQESSPLQIQITNLSNVIKILHKVTQGSHSHHENKILILISSQKSHK
jgi:hypothetical protein